MPKRKKRRQNDSSRAMQQALDHYECALRNLEDADEPAALEALDFAEVFLERAQDDEVRRGLVAEVSLARGALLEVADPCLLYTSPSPRDQRGSRMPSSA